MPGRPPALPALLDRLEKLYGRPKRPVPKKALDWILWENAAYLVPDERRETAYAALKKATRLHAAGILSLPREALEEIAALGGMLADLRVLLRLGLAQDGKSYSASYRAAILAFEPYLARGCPWLMRAHSLPRDHGQELCKQKGPLCGECPLDEVCPSADL